ncbi:MAG: electron transport complex subunit E [Spirochaetales bacterium]|nr:electron transport complex subunit E [Spirochaetales bacterium]
MTVDTFTAGIWKENPVFVMLLGLCPALAVSNTAVNSLVMGAATTLVLVASSVLVSLLRNLIPRQVRIASYIMIIATFVTAVDYAIKAVSLELYNQLGAFIQLIVVNCIILGRCEAYASKNRLSKSVVNSLGMGIGFTLALFMIGSIREVLGFGTFFGVALFGAQFQTWAIFVLPPGGFIVVSLWLSVFAASQWRRSRSRTASVRKEHAHAD